MPDYSPEQQRHGKSPLPWRVGTKVGRTIYDAADRLIGVMDTVDDAKLVVNSVNDSQVYDWYSKE